MPEHQEILLTPPIIVPFALQNRSNVSKLAATSNDTINQDKNVSERTKMYGSEIGKQLVLNSRSTSSREYHPNFEGYKLGFADKIGRPICKSGSLEVNTQNYFFFTSNIYYFLSIYIKISIS